MTPDWYSQLEAILIRDEGLRLRPYLDSRDNWTIGVGRYIGPNLRQLRITEATAKQMLQEDISHAVADACRLIGAEQFNSLPAARQHAIVSLVFNLGYPKLRNEFIQTVPALVEGRFEDAARFLKDSLWARQVKGRAERIIAMLLNAEHPEEYDV